MKTLNKNQMKYLSFPDFGVEKVEFIPKEKKLIIVVEGAYLDENEGQLLGKGTLFFNEWEDISFRKYDFNADTWSVVNESDFEPLKDICEEKFDGSTVYLCGFGKLSGQWMEYKIQNAKIQFTES